MYVCIHKFYINVQIMHITFRKASSFYEEDITLEPFQQQNSIWNMYIKA